MTLNVGTSSEMLKEVEARFIRMEQIVAQILAARKIRTAPSGLIDEERRKAGAKAKYDAAGMKFTPFRHAVE
jgi:hypothetical protein